MYEYRNFVQTIVLLIQIQTKVQAISVFNIYNFCVNSSHVNY